MTSAFVIYKGNNRNLLKPFTFKVKHWFKYHLFNFQGCKCSLSYGNPPAKQARLGLSDCMETDKQSGLSDSSDLESNKDNPKSDDESKSHDE